MIKQFNKNNYQTPKIEIPGDKQNIMLRHAEIIAAIKTKALWRVGFMKDSESGRHYGCFTEKFYWLVCDIKGDVLEKVESFYIDLPVKFKKTWKI